LSKSAYPAIYKQLLSWGGREVDIDKLIEKHGSEKMEYYITYTRRQLKQGKVAGTPFGYFRGGIQQNWTDPIQEKNKKVAEKKRQLVERKVRIIALQNKRQEVVDAYLNERRSIATKYFEKDRAALEQLFEEIKSSKAYQVPLHHLYKRLGEGISVTDAYKDQKFGWGVILIELHIQNPALFAKLVKKYQSKVASYDERLEEYNIRSKSVFWGVESK